VTRLRDLREDRDLKQRDLAEYLNIHQSTYSDYELGNLNVPVPVLVKLSYFYETSVDYLLGLTNTKEPYPKLNRK
jgi:transcriptional regulator with XRE-family HTH domain